MSDLQIRASDECAYDVVTLGEVMLRLDPGEGRVRTTRTFHVSEGGGEYNVGRALRTCFGRRVAHVTAIADNDVGRLLEDLMLQGGVDLSHVVWTEADDVGRRNRTPLNFTERGFGVRAPHGVSDRAHSATASLAPGDIDWDRLFGELGVRWFHTGGIFAGLSTTTAEVAREAMATARRHGTIVSYDVNFRASLWSDRGGSAAAEALTEDLLDHVDVLFGIGTASADDAAAPRAADRHEGLVVVAGPERDVRSASSHRWSGVLWTRSGGWHRGRVHEALEVLDRVGGGDGFAAGVIFGLLDGRGPSAAVELGVAHGALVMTTPGDTSMVDLSEVERLAEGGDATIRR